MTVKYLEIENLTSAQQKAQCVFELQELDDLKSDKFGMFYSTKCETCQRSNNCLGHLGYIKLPFPTVRPILAELAIKVINLICINCLNIAIDADNQQQFLDQIALIKQPNYKCPHCTKHFQTFNIINLNIKNSALLIPMFFQVTINQAYQMAKILQNIQVPVSSDQLVYLNPYLIVSILQRIITQKEIQYFDFQPYLLECFLSDIIVVPPQQYRIHVLASSTEGKNSNTLNQIYTKIIQDKLIIDQLDFLVDDIYINEAVYQRYIKEFDELIISARVVQGKDTSPNTPPEIKKIILKKLSIKTLEPASLISHSVTKYGWFRQLIAAVRVNQSARTVAGGAPMNDTDVVEIPQMFATTLSVPVVVNNANIEILQGLIDNYPNYPCAVRRETYNQYGKNILKIIEQNKIFNIEHLQIGDIVYRQLIDNDLCLVNRYPSIREESFGLHRIKINDQKTINFPITVIDKMGADFDGDEMQLFALGSSSDTMESLCLMSMAAQFIAPDEGTNIIGGKDKGDMGTGIFNLQNNKFNEDIHLDPNGKTGLELIQNIIDKVFKDKQFLTYEDKRTKITKGKLQYFGTNICSKKSQFLQDMAVYYPTCLLIEMADDIIRLSYKTNQAIINSINNIIFLNNKQQNELQALQIGLFNKQQEILDTYYTGNMIAPSGVSTDLFYQKLLSDGMTSIELPQIDIIDKYIKPKQIQTFFDTILADKKMAGIFKSGMAQLGQQYNFGLRIQNEERYQRRLINQPKFIELFTYAGYVTNCFIQGLKQSQMFMHQMCERYQMFKRGNATPITGYLSRRLNQGMSNIFATYNGLCQMDGEQIISYQYGLNGCDPRFNYFVPFTYHQQNLDDIAKKYKKHPKLNEILNIWHDFVSYEFLLKQANPFYNGFDQINIPFKLIEKKITVQQLEQILSCRLTDQMTDNLKQIIINQSLPFYIYCLFECEIVKTNDFPIIQKYIESCVQCGEPVGLKAALGCSQIFTQAALSAIHTSGKEIEIDKVQRTFGYDRFSELVTNDKGFTVVQFQLFKSKRFDLQAYEDFVSRHQTYYFKELNPIVQILQTENLLLDKKTYINDDKLHPSTISNYVINIEINWDLYCYLDTNTQNLYNQLLEQNVNIKNIFCYINDEVIGFNIYFNLNINLNTVFGIKNKILDLQIGSAILQNMTIKASSIGYVIHANLNTARNKNSLKELYKIPYVDHETVYCNNHLQVYECFGIVKGKNSLYLELLNNFYSSSDTKGLQPIHAKIIVDALTFTGNITSFTRTSYRKDSDNRDLIGLLTFESSWSFLQDALTGKQQVQQLNTLLNACIYGTRCEMGSTVSNIIFNNILQQIDLDIDE